MVVVVVDVVVFFVFVVVIIIIIIIITIIIIIIIIIVVVVPLHVHAAQLWYFIHTFDISPTLCNPKQWSYQWCLGERWCPFPILSWLVKNRNCQFMQYFSLVHWLRSLRAPEESGRFLMFLSSIRLPATNVHPLFSLKPRRFFNWCNYVKLVTTFSLTGAGLNILNSPFWSRVMLD